jgi:hypothetical protein
MKKITPFCIFLFLIVFVSCKKEKESSENSESSSEYPYYFSATINGKAVKYEANDIGSRYDCGVSSPYSAIDDDYDFYEGTFIQDSEDETKNNIYVYILQRFNGGEPTYNQRVGMFHLGSYSYGYSNIDDNLPTINGASIYYIDEKGIEWWSEAGSQSGSTFKITEISDIEDGTSDKIFKASFSCKLYDSDGNSIQVTNAQIRGKILLP